MMKHKFVSDYKSHEFLRVTDLITNTPSCPCTGSPVTIALVDGSIDTTPSTLSLGGIYILASSSAGSSAPSLSTLTS